MYEVYETEMGHVKTETVRVVNMPHSRFMEIVDKLLKSFDDDVKDFVRPTAERMDRFPFGAWMTKRGCGCVVGEALVERELIKRGEDQNVAMELMKRRVFDVDGEELDRFGCVIDVALAEEVLAVGHSGIFEPDALVLTR